VSLTRSPARYGTESSWRRAYRQAEYPSRLVQSHGLNPAMGHHWARARRGFGPRRRSRRSLFALFAPSIAQTSAAPIDAPCALIGRSVRTHRPPPRPPRHCLTATPTRYHHVPFERCECHIRRGSTKSQVKLSL
jgi:hypothetical protein